MVQLTKALKTWVIPGHTTLSKSVMIRPSDYLKCLPNYTCIYKCNCQYKFTFHFFQEMSENVLYCFTASKNKALLIKFN